MHIEVHPSVMPHTTSTETKLLPFAPLTSTAYIVEGVGIGQPCAQRWKQTGQSNQSLSTGREVVSFQSKEGISACFTTSEAAATPPIEEELMEIIPVRSVVTHTTVLSPARTIDLKKVLYILVTPYFATAWKDAITHHNGKHSTYQRAHNLLL